MKKEFLVYDKEYVIQFYLKHSHNRTIKRVLVEGDTFGDLKSSVTRYFVLNTLKTTLEFHFNSIFVVQYHHIVDKLEITEMSMTVKEITATFPYGEYDKYLPYIQEVNDFLGDRGILDLFANNVPYCLEAGIALKVDRDYDLVLDKIKSLPFEIDYSKGMDEVMSSLLSKQCNIISLPKDISLERLRETSKLVFLIPPKTSYEERGYDFSDYSKKKLFVSYSHKNKEVVHKIIENLRSYGLDFWLDEEQIDVGDRLMERIHQGIVECDLPIIFLSQETKESAFALHELQSFFSKIIYQKEKQKSWFIVRLDDVKPSDISFGLGDFKYIDYDGQDSENIARSIKRKIYNK